MSDDWGETAEGWGGGIDEEVDPSETSEPRDPDEPSEPDRTSDPSDIKLASPIKKEWDEYPSYLYPDLHEEVEETFMDLEYQCKKEADFSPQKYRHFQAVAWHIALEELQSMDADEFMARIDDIGLR